MPAIATRLPQAKGPRDWREIRGKVNVSLPAHAAGAIHVADATDGTRSLTITPRGLRAVALSPLEHAQIATDAAPAMDLLVAADDEHVEEVRLVREARDEIVAEYDVVRGAGIASLRANGAVVEAIDARGRVALTPGVIFAVDARGARREARVRVDGDAVRVTIDARGLVPPVALDPAWTTTTGVLAGLHSGGSLVTLADQRVLYAGGFASGSGYAGVTTSTELFDPATQKWTIVGAMNVPRTRASAVRVADGKIFIFGGQDNTGAVLQSAEWFDPTSLVWTLVPTPMKAARSNYNRLITAVLLPSGKVFVSSGNATVAPEIFDPATGTSTLTTAVPAALVGSAVSVALMTDGKIAFTGSGALSLYDPGADTWSPPNTSFTGGSGPVFALPGARALVVGSATSSLFTESTNTFDPSSSTTGCILSAVFPLPTSGKVFGWGRAGCGGTCGCSVDYDLSTSFWSTAASDPGNGEAIAQTGSGFLQVNGTDSFLFTAAANGAACTSNGDCDSDHCVDGVCCNNACTGACQACDVTTAKGTCTIVSGAPHGARTCVGTGACGGSCDGIKAICNYAATTVSCSTAGCAAGKATSAGTCDGAGTCNATAPIACSPYACGATACNTACSKDAECDAAAYCDVAAGKCKVGPKPDGASCAADTECQNGHCVGTPGVCCKTACDLGCNACGTGTCTPKGDGTICGGTTCSGATFVTQACNAGTCKAQAGGPCGGGLLCADTTSCKAKCSSGADCVSGTCDTASGTCQSGDAGTADAGTGDAAEVGVLYDATPPLASKPLVSSAFQTCGKDADCTSGHCVDRICCDTACTDRCHSCALLGSPGVCTLEPAGVDLKNECGASSSCTGTCGPLGECIGAGPGTMCERNACTGSSTGVGAAYCAGPGAPCNNAGVVPFDCSPYACAPAVGACLTICNSSNDCANGFLCDVASRQCVPLPAPTNGGGCTVGDASGRSGEGAFAFVAALALTSALGRARRRRG
ncbi:MAG: kelch repeat-containing protein [Polyangiales bacterium]